MKLLAQFIKIVILAMVIQISDWYSICILLNKTEGSSVDASGVYANELQSILKVIICWTFIVLFHILKFFKNLKYRNYLGSSFDKTLKTNNIIIIPSNKKCRSLLSYSFLLVWKKSPKALLLARYFEYENTHSTRKL